MILRRLARPLLASIFISGGINAFRSTEGHAQVAKPFLDKTVGQQTDVLPESVPTDPVSLVRVDGTVKLAAGAALALGKFQRLSSLMLLGSLVPTTLAAHAFWEYTDESQRQQQMTQFIKNTSLAGGLLFALADTKGKPSAGWRARRAARKASQQVAGTSESVQGNVRDVQRKSGRCVSKAKKKAGAA